VRWGKQLRNWVVGEVIGSVLGCVLGCVFGGGEAAAEEKLAVVTSERSRRVVATQTPRLEAELKAGGWTWGAPVYIRAFKRERILELWLKRGDRFEIFRQYPICAMSGGLGPKQRQGDQQVPEGLYAITRRSLNPYSVFHLSMNIGYPNPQDRQLRRTGGDIMIHGNCVSLGCLAMTDAGIEEIYTLVQAALTANPRGVPVHIFPFRMESLELWRHWRWPHFEFWRKLKPVYDSPHTAGGGAASLCNASSCRDKT